jgi:hypothetical protein
MNGLRIAFAIVFGTSLAMAAHIRKLNRRSML